MINLPFKFSVQQNKEYRTILDIVSVQTPALVCFLFMRLSSASGIYLLNGYCFNLFTLYFHKTPASWKYAPHFDKLFPPIYILLPFLKGNYILN